MDSDRTDEGPDPLPWISEDRQRELDAIIAKLDPYQRRYLHAKLASKTFQFDIVGGLPLELVGKIFAHADIEDILQCQRVSKRWKFLLSTSAVLDPRLNRWYSLSDPPLTRSSDPTVNLPLLKLKHIWQYTHHKPSSTAIYHAQHAPGDLSKLRKFQYHHGRVAWLEGDKATVRDLRSGEVKVHFGTARETLGLLCLTEELMAVWTYSGICYVYELFSDVSKSFRLPSIQSINAIGGRGQTIACVTSESGQDKQLSIFSFDDGSIQHTPLNNTGSLVFILEGIRFLTGSIFLTAFDTVQRESEPKSSICVLHVLCCTLAGKVVQDITPSRIPATESFGEVLQDGGYLMCTTRSTDYDGSFAILCNAQSRRSKYAGWVVQFDRNGASTILREYDSFRAPFLRWKDIEHGKRFGDVGAYFHQSVFDLRSNPTRLETRAKEQSALPWIGDELFLVSAEGECNFKVLCFDPLARLPPSSPGYTYVSEKIPIEDDYIVIEVKKVTC
ncbi:hypothetical protein NA57DRAFT_77892 [Rhizodiscina lignyota]|uniref:F-box domain-containing protein n=1 Tax=Rhizodiscina lignyota TaxID=1504668 RepID=A0A9P4I9U1_9PEZI|nr:hypothetical protein NA57DRAFT_77892 [Rhizodiscina lignyota]